MNPQQKCFPFILNEAMYFLYAKLVDIPPIILLCSNDELDAKNGKKSHKNRQYINLVFFVGFTILIVITRTWVVTPTKKVVVLTNKISVAYLQTELIGFISMYCLLTVVILSQKSFL